MISTAVFIGGCIFYVPTMIFLPKIPMSFYSIYPDENDDLWWRSGLTFFEWYLYPVAWGLLATGNILICITYKVVSNCVRALSRGVKLDPNHRNVDWVNRQYQTVFLITNNLNDVFSLSLLCQEFAFLMVIAYLFVGASNLAHESGRPSEVFYGINLEYSYFLSIQFYPMIVLNLNSCELLLNCRSYLVSNKYTRMVTERFRELKIRPLGVHTVTLGTLEDYVVFVASFILMLLKR